MAERNDYIVLRPSSIGKQNHLDCEKSSSSLCQNLTSVSLQKGLEFLLFDAPFFFSFKKAFSEN